MFPLITVHDQKIIDFGPMRFFVNYEVTNHVQEIPVITVLAKVVKAEFSWHGNEKQAK